MSWESALSKRGFLVALLQLTAVRQVIGSYTLSLAPGEAASCVAFPRGDVRICSVLNQHLTHFQVAISSCQR